MPAPIGGQRAAGHVSRTDGHVGAAVQGGDEVGQRARIVLEVRVHLDERVVSAIEAPTKSGLVGRAETALGGAAEHEDPVGADLRADRLGHIRSSVRARVVDHHHRRPGEDATDVLDDCADVPGLVEGGQHNQRTTDQRSTSAVPRRVAQIQLRRLNIV